MKILFDINHPAQAHLFRPVIESANQAGDTCEIVARDKDITLQLLSDFGLSCSVLAPVGRGLAGQFGEFLKREVAMFRYVRRERPDIITGTSVNAARISRLYNAKSVILCEDDAKYIPLFRWLAYPMASAIVTPDGLAYENHGTRHLTYPSYQKLFYLHPNRFEPDRAVLTELGISPGDRFAIIRLSSLVAHHDIGARGMSDTLVRRIIELAAREIRVFITSEKPLAAEFEPHRLPIPPDRVHDALAFAEFFIGDSQSMTMESALLGTPAFKINTFAGIITVIRELEDYGLAYGYRPGEEEKLVRDLEDVLGLPDRGATFAHKRQNMLSDKIDPLPWFLEILRRLSRDPIADVRAWSDEAIRSKQFAHRI